MLEFVFVTILMVSLSTVLYLMVRALPRVTPDPAEEERRGLLDRWAHSELPEKVDLAMNGFLLKFLRKVKIWILRLDNSLSRHLQRIKPEDMSKKSNIDFKEIAGQNKESESDI